MKRRHDHLAAVPVATVVADADADAARTAVAPTQEGLAWEASVDGTRVRITARDEVTLQCGKASIVLRRNGRIIIRGTYVETRSAGTNRIRGGQVRIN